MTVPTPPCEKENTENKTGGIFFNVKGAALCSVHAPITRCPHAC